MIQDNITQKCAAMIYGLKYEDLDDKTIDHAKKCIIDWLGCVLGGASTKPAKIIHKFINELGGRQTSSIIGEFQKTNIINAALINGYNCHILEMDDVHRKSILHPAAPTISAAFSTAEAYERSGKELITSIVAGYDIAIRTGEAVSPSHYFYFHTTGTCGTFGAAAASAKLLDLEPVQILYSLGNAGSQAAGLWEFMNDNAMTKYLHCGKAAMNGIIASMLAKDNFTGAKRILEGDRGFFKAYSKEKDFGSKFEDMGKHFKINEIAFKPYASCRHTHASIYGLLNLKNRYGIKADDVEEIIIETYATALRIAGNTRFSDEMSAKFSLIYCAAAAMLYGKLGVSEFTQEKLNNDAIKDLVKKIKVYINSDINNEYPNKWESKITIRTKDRLVDTFVEYPKGDPENSLDDREIEEKFLGLAKMRIPDEKAKEVLLRCKNMESFGNMKTFFEGL